MVFKMFYFNTVILAAVATLCASQDLGDHDYIACDDCRIPDGEFPEEGKMVCFEVRSVSREYIGYYQKCHKVTCDPFDIFCVPGEQCEWVQGTILEQECELERKTGYESIPQVVEGEYQIYSPLYYHDEDYRNNTYCVWNVANSGFVSFHVIDQQLQQPANANSCSGPGCDCPDGVTVTMGTNGFKLCGSTLPSPPLHVSSNGLNVIFCSDNKHTAKGFLMRAYTSSGGTTVGKREAQKRLTTSPTENAVCQYDYMMRASQPDASCPDKQTILSMLKYHDHFMSALTKNKKMCSKLRYPVSMNTEMPMMNKIEMCAVEYLYRTLDHAFAKIVVNSANKELSGVAHAVINNKLVKKVKTDG